MDVQPVRLHDRGASMEGQEGKPCRQAKGCRVVQGEQPAKVALFDHCRQFGWLVGGTFSPRALLAARIWAAGGSPG